MMPYRGEMRRAASKFEKQRANTEIGKREQAEKKERRKNVEKMQRLLGEMSQELREQKVPVESDCRINMNNFSGLRYTNKKGKTEFYNITQDNVYVDERERRFHGNLPEKKKLESAGEQFEMLATIVLHKFLKDNFIVVRASRYDDIANKIDTVIVEKETGNVVCALDEVALSEEEMRQKRDQWLPGHPDRLDKETLAQYKNIQEGGATLKYGVTTNEQGEVIKKKIDNIPVFYFALPSKRALEKLMKNLERSLKKISLDEKRLLGSFLKSMEAQIDTLGLDELDPELEKKLDQYEEVLKKIMDKNF